MNVNADLPGVLDEIADIAGRDAALDLAAAFGGSTLHVPAPGRVHSHALAHVLGDQRARQVAERFQGDVVYVPKCRRAVARRMRSQGRSTRDIASVMGVSRRAVQQMLR